MDLRATARCATLLLTLAPSVVDESVLGRDAVHLWIALRIALWS